MLWHGMQPAHRARPGVPKHFAPLGVPCCRELTPLGHLRSFDYAYQNNLEIFGAVPLMPRCCCLEIV